MHMHECCPSAIYPFILAHSHLGSLEAARRPLFQSPETPVGERNCAGRVVANPEGNAQGKSVVEAPSSYATTEQRGYLTPLGEPEM